MLPGCADDPEGKEDAMHNIKVIIGASYGDEGKGLATDFFGAREEWREEHLSTEKCPICGSEMYIREGKYGKFLGCSDYPDCKGVRKIKSDGDNCKTKQPSTEKCPKCGGKMYIREGKYGKFLGCSNYPKCKGTRKI